MHWSPDIALGVNKFRRKGLRHQSIEVIVGVYT